MRTALSSLANGAGWLCARAHHLSLLFRSMCPSILLLNSICWCRHLGDFFKGRGAHATPLMHGFDHMFMTQEVAPTSTTNCACDPAWESQCRFGHNKPWACTNYWAEDPSAPVRSYVNQSIDQAMSGSFYQCKPGARISVIMRL